MWWEGGGGGRGPAPGPALLAVVVSVVALLAEQVHAEVLTPPYFNLAQNRFINASATCGVDSQGPELYCKLVGANADRDGNINLIQGQVCDYCDASDPDKRHPAEYAVDGAETWWQSPPLSRSMKYNEVNLTIDLGQLFHVAYVLIKMANSPRPAIWVLERSTDDGKTYIPWQYFADSPGECEAFFGPETLLPITRDDQVICETEYSKIVPLEGGEIVISFLNKRPSANDFFNSTVLQEFTKATNVRLRFLRTKTLLGHLMSVARQDPTVTRRYFYSIKDISIGGRCVCNGHAENCDKIDPRNRYKLLCDCKHNTCGANCDKCCPGFEQKRWRQSKHHELFECEPCNCHGHSKSCKYNETVDLNRESLDIHGNLEGGGVCENCMHNTTGINCNKCLPKFYRPTGKPLNATDVCQPCQCNDPRFTGDCYDGIGQCMCKANFTSPYCDSCNQGYYSYPNCYPCDCFPKGARGDECIATNGVCQCKPAYGGALCKECNRGYFGFPDCEACECNLVGSTSDVCQKESGKCPCLNNFGGRQCDKCADGYHTYPQCLFCKCDASGTIPEVCDKESGKCLCKEGYGGERCDACKPGYHGYPNCRPCNCSDVGSVSAVCDAKGKCACRSNFAGLTCDQCRPGYYRFPECLSCNCNLHGSHGQSCDDNGHCQCRNNFEGAHCERCREGLFNFPICEECNCDPRGVLSSWLGCGSLPPGELCTCKPRVDGRTCNKCKPKFWNLQSHHREGCEECNCYLPGVMGEIDVCDTVSGQCLCKPSVGSRQCDVCKDGSYYLSGDNLFGCSDCGCDIGGSASGICNKTTGYCTCHPRIEGRTCNKAITMSYFPTLHHLQFEAEDGMLPLPGELRFDSDENFFPNFSWKGYANFLVPQNEILYNVKIDSSSLYRMVLRYMKSGPASDIAHITITPESPTDYPQSFQVLLKPTNGTPAFTTVGGPTNSIPSPLVMDPGNWLISIKYHGSQPLHLDYFTLLPSAYYEAEILVKPISEPCTVGNQSLCQQYHYPKVGGCDIVRGETALIDEFGNRQPIREIYENEMHLSVVGLASKPAMLSPTQQELHLDLTISEPGSHILLVNYITPLDVNFTTKVILIIDNEQLPQAGRAVLYPCPYSTACRQAIIDDQGRVTPFRLDENYIKLVLKAEGSAYAAIDCIIAIPFEDWSLDYIQPKPLCVKKEGKCVSANFPSPPDSKKFELEQSKIPVSSSEARAPNIADNTSTLFYLDYSNPTANINGNVPGPNQYVFVVHYYQPDNPGYKLDAVLQKGLSSEGKLDTVDYIKGELPILHCPSNFGCRSVIQQSDGSNRTLLSDFFNLTLSQPMRQPTHFGVWIDYVLVVPVEQFSDKMLRQDNFDQTGAFISQCGQNHFYIDPKTKGFCRDAVFSLTTDFHKGALPCDCNIDGSSSIVCEEFGGQCPCKPYVIGRRCEKCKFGYYGFPDCQPCDCPKGTRCDENTGQCKCAANLEGERCEKCKENTFGLNPRFGCEECNCSPLGVANGNLQCDLISGDCSCKENIVGRHCDKCLEGHWLFPQCHICDCDLRGSTPLICDQENAQCYCKANVEGEACDVCKEGSFDIQASNDEGCTNCFCFGKTTRCNSASLFRAQIMNMDDWELATVLYQPTVVVTPLSLSPGPPGSDGIGIAADLTEEAVGKVVFFKAPKNYYGNMLTAYGGNLNFTLFYTTGIFGGAVAAPDVILHGSATKHYLLHFSNEQPAASKEYYGSVPIIEESFVLTNGLHVSREILMQTLQTLDEIYIRATYWDTSVTSRLWNVSLDTAQEQYSSNGIAHAVEQCLCPPGYKGLSCEDCAPGYYRLGGGRYGGSCIPCQCNGHSDVCDPVTGICMDCQHHTTGDHCEQCVVGYHGNATRGLPDDCLICACPLPIASNNFATGCLVSPDGDSISCDCKEGYFGARCESCAAGYYGRPEVQGDYCKPCVCNNNIDPSDANACDSVSGECMHCLNNTFGESCQYCAPGYFGDAIQRKDCQNCICDKCGTAQCNNYTGICECKPNVAGEKCDTCEPDHYGFSKCQAQALYDSEDPGRIVGRMDKVMDGCYPCNCGLASESTQCDDDSGQCRCKPGVKGKTCEMCKPGFYNYTKDGCISCGCTTDYSVGLGCNNVTGKCECLPGVIGDKCDHCPYRWVLKKNEGCFECDSCHHGLLDVTDELAATIDPQRADFESAAASHFTNKRLEYINETALDMWPKVEKLQRVDFGPFTKAVQDLIKDAELHNRNGALKLEAAQQIAPAGYSVHQALLGLEDSMAVASDKAEKTVEEINKITFNLAGSGPQTEYSIRDGERLLEEMNQRDFSDALNVANDALVKAKVVKEAMEKFAEPVANHSLLLNELHEHLDAFDSKLEDLRNQSDSSLKKTSKATSLNEQNKKATVKSKVSDVKNLEASAQASIKEARQLLNNTAVLLTDAQENFAKIETEAAVQLDTFKNTVNESITEQAVKLNEVQDLKVGADVHAEQMEKLAKQIENLLSPARDKSQYALGAANAYVDIVNATQEALRIAQEAFEDAKNASDSLTGLGSRTFESRERSKELHQNARGRLKEAQETLAPKLKMAINNVEFVKNLTNFGGNGIDDIERGLANIPARSEINPLVVAKESMIARDSVSTAFSDIGDILAMLPEQSKVAKRVPKDFDESRDAKGQADNQLRSLPSMKAFNEAMADVSRRQMALNASADAARDAIEILKKKVAEARENTNRIKVGVRFYPNTTLQLRNPESLSQQTTSSRLSVFFKTFEPNGFILYLGNEKDSYKTLRRTKSDDYLSLVIENEYPVLTVDLGSGPQRVIVNKRVSDGKWYQAIIERIGKSARLTIREELENGGEVLNTKEEVINGTYSILNLDPEQSKIFVGGYPNSFKIQDEIKESWFDGEMEDLMVGDTPVSLWNFVDGANNRNGCKERKRPKNITPNTGYRFNGSGYVAMDVRSYLQNERSSVQFKFQTKTRDGLLFLIGNKDQFLAVELRDGRVLYQFDLGAGPVRILSPEGVKYNDGRWHSVEASRDKLRGVLKTDGVDSKVVDSGGWNGTLLPSSEMYFGGYPDTHSYRDVTNFDFDGCIDYVQIESATVDLRKNVKATGVTPGCPPKFVGQVSFSNKYPGYLRWTKVDAVNEVQLTLRFKTSSTDSGLMAYVTNADQTVTLSLSMVDGYLVLRSKNAEVTSNSSPLNDGQWHVVTATYIPSGVQLDIDDLKSYETRSTPAEFAIEDGSLFFGGIPKEFDFLPGSGPTLNSFVGCIEHATIGRTLINFANITDRSNVIFNKCPDNLVDYPPPSFDDDDITSNPEEDQDVDNEAVGIVPYIPPQPSSPSVTLPTPAPTPSAGCALPLTPASDPDVREESGIRFGSKPFSRYEFASLPSPVKRKYELSLEFKTDQLNGSIFFVSDKSSLDHIALYLVNGKVHYSFNCGSGTALLISQNPYNDNDWHTVVFSRNFTQGTLTIDEVLVASGSSSGQSKTLEVKPPFYLGGLSDSVLNNLKNSSSSLITLSRVPGFVGCLRSFKMNRKLVGNLTLTEGVLPCSDKVEKGFFIGPEGGFIEAIDRFKFGVNFEVSLEVKPRYTSGILLALQGSRELYTLQMINGVFKFTVNHGKGPISVTYNALEPEVVCNGEWIKVQAFISQGVVVLGVNNMFLEPKIETDQATNDTGKLYLGGHPNPRDLPDVETTEQFVGCVRELIVIRNNRAVPVKLNAQKTFGSVISNVCPTI